MKLFTIICAAAIAVGGSLNAQGLVNTVSAHFATPVVVGVKTLPAGDCTIQVIRGSSDSVVLSLRAATGETSNILVTRLYDGNPVMNGNANIILERRADGVHFERIWLPDHTGFEALPN